MRRPCTGISARDAAYLRALAGAAPGVAASDHKHCDESHGTSARDAAHLLQRALAGAVPRATASDHKHSDDLATAPQREMRHACICEPSRGPRREPQRATADPCDDLAPASQRERYACVRALARTAPGVAASDCKSCDELAPASQREMRHTCCSEPSRCLLALFLLLLHLLMMALHVIKLGCQAALLHLLFSCLSSAL